MDATELRKRMAANPFAPNGATPELRVAAAAEYIAYYLGEIESHLSKSAAHQEANTNVLSKISGHLSGISSMLPTLLGK